MTPDQIKLHLLKVNPRAKVFDGFDAALIGTADVGGHTVAAYSRPKVHALVMKQFEMDAIDAEQKFHTDLYGSNSNQPVFVTF